MEVNSRSVLQSASWISEHSKYVRIPPENVATAAKKLLELRANGEFNPWSWKEGNLNPKVANADALKWIFLVDLWNFSFWSDHPTEIACILYQGKPYTGYWSLCAAVDRALDEGIPLHDPTYMKSVTLQQIQSIFRTENGIEIPLLNERVAVMQEAGKVLLEKFEGRVTNILKLANGSALKLVDILTTEFRSFDDQCKFLDRNVYFFKRAQIFVADVWACFEGQSFGYFPDIDDITMFADYRVPQALLYLGALEYTAELTELLKSKILQPGDVHEIEIRGNSIWSVELILREMKALLSALSDASQEPLNAIAIDFFLWNYAKQNSDDVRMKSLPIHKIRTIFY